ncbi:MAG: hypothetical protein OCD01_08805 [Fibrobacterales bacterium]
MKDIPYTERRNANFRRKDDKELGKLKENLDEYLKVQYLSKKIHSTRNIKEIAYVLNSVAETFLDITTARVYLFDDANKLTLLFEKNDIDTENQNELDYLLTILEDGVQFPQIVHEHGVVSLVVPLFAHDESIGGYIIKARVPEETELENSILELLDVLSGHASLAIWSQIQKERYEKRIQHQSGLLRIINSLYVESDPDIFTQKLLNTLTRELNLKFSFFRDFENKKEMLDRSKHYGFEDQTYLSRSAFLKNIYNIQFATLIHDGAPGIYQKELETLGVSVLFGIPVSIGNTQKGVIMLGCDSQEHLLDNETSELLQGLGRTLCKYLI